MLSAAGFSLFLNLLYLTVPIYCLQVYDRILSSASETTLLLITLAATVSLAVLGLLDALRAWVLARAGVRMERLLGSAVLDLSIERALAWSSLERGQAVRDLETLRQSLAGPAVLAVFDLPWIPVYLVVLFLVHWSLGALALVFGALLVGLALANERSTRASLTAAQAAGAASHGFAEASLRNAEAVRAMGMFPAIQRRWDRDRVAGVVALLRFGDRTAMFGSAIKFVRLLAQIMALGLGAYLAIRQQVTSGAIFAASMLMARAIQPVEQVVGSWRQITGAHHAWRRLDASLAQPRAADRLELPRPAGRVSAEELTFVPRGSRKPAVEGISFVAEPGEALGIIGATAAGKSTLLRLLAGIYPPNSGSARIDGASTFQWSRESLGQYVGYLPQDVQLFPGTIADNIARFGELDHEGVISAARLAGVHDMLVAMPQGYETQVLPQGGALSGGQRQLIALARAVYGSPSVVLLDEPNANLDALGESRLVECMQKLKRAGATVIVVSHRTSALSVVDRILCLQDGRLVGLGPRNEILARLSRFSPVAPIRAGDA